MSPDYWRARFTKMLRCIPLAPGTIQALRAEEPRWLWCFWLRIVTFVVAVVTSISMGCVIEWTKNVGGQVRSGGWDGWWGVGVIPVCVLLPLVNVMTGRLLKLHQASKAISFVLFTAVAGNLLSSRD